MENFYDVLRISICSILSPMSEETVIGIIHAIQNAGFEALSDLQFMQENDFMSVLKPIPRRKLIKMWSIPGVIEELKCEYERKKNEDVSHQIDEFLAEAKKSSGYTTNSVTMESITELLKTNICRILNSISEETLNDIINALKCAGLELLLDLQFVREDDLTHVLKPIPRRKLVRAWSQQSILFLFSNAPTVVHQPIAADHNTHVDSSAELSFSIHDLTMPTQRQAYIDQTCDPSPLEPSSGIPDLNYKFYGPWLNVSFPGFPNLTDQDPLPHELPPGADSFTSVGESIPPVKSSNLLPKKFKWNQNKYHVLLKVYAKYKTELPSTSVNKNHEVWKKIAEEVSQKCNSFRSPKDRKSHIFISVLDCMDKIEILKKQYHAQKNKKVRVDKRKTFFSNAANAFETTENSVTTLAELSSNPSLPSFKWVWNKRVALLRLYTIFKTELSSSNIEEQLLWKKIAEKVREKWSIICDAKQCQDQINSMKLEYEDTKYINPCELSRIQAVFLDEAENAFENIENPVVLSMQSHLGKRTMSRREHVKLLQVFSKYKAELLLHNFDVEQQIVWGKVAREMSKKCYFYFGKRWCCYEINHFKHHYEKFKKYNLKTCGKPYFFDEAKKAFESTECSDTYVQKAKKSHCDNRASRNHTHLNMEVQDVQRIVVQNTDDVLQRGAAPSGQHGEVNSLKDFTVNQKRRSWYEHISI